MKKSPDKTKCVDVNGDFRNLNNSASIKSEEDENKDAIFKTNEESVRKREEEKTYFMAKNSLKRKVDEGDNTTSHSKEKVLKREVSSPEAGGCYSDEEDDLEGMLTWKNNVGYLPDSDIRFRKNQLSGELEVITGDSDADEDDEDDDEFTEKKSRRRKSTKSGVRRHEAKSPVPLASAGVKARPTSLLRQVEPPTGSRLVSPDSTDKRRRKDRKKKKQEEEDIVRCESCGDYGLLLEFRSSGRFCSQRCVSAFTSQSRAERLSKQSEPPERKVSGVRASPTVERKSVASPTTERNKSTMGGKKRRGKQEQDGQDSRKGSPVDFSDEDFSALPIIETLTDEAIRYYESREDLPFSWDSYLTFADASVAPADCFFETPRFSDSVKASDFKTKMKLECTDPKHQSHFCVVTVMEVRGERLRLHFDGWSECYDFWVNGDSPLLRPCGWCQSQGIKIDRPNGKSAKEFSWDEYLHQTGCEAAPDSLFSASSSESSHEFTPRMKLEAVDRQNPDLVCVASIAMVTTDQLLVHFDGWDDLFDYWCYPDSPMIHPIGWCEEHRLTLVPPTDDMVGMFSWTDYLKETKSIAPAKGLFKKRTPPRLFSIGDKLEVVDPRNPSLLRVASVSGVASARVRVHLDGWAEQYDFWTCADSPDLHPVGWAKQTGHPLEPPPRPVSDEPTSSDEKVCPTPCCRGVGHMKGARFTSHHSSVGCPYSQINLNRLNPIVPDRLVANALPEESSIQAKVYNIVAGQITQDNQDPDSTTKLGDPARTKSATSTSVKTKSKSKPLSSIVDDAKSDSSAGSPSAIKSNFPKRRRRPSNEVSSTSCGGAGANSPASTGGASANSPTATSSASADTQPVRQKPVPPTRRPAWQPRHSHGDLLVAPLRVLPWTLDDVSTFLRGLDQSELVDRFRDHLIDGQALLLLSQTDLVRHLNIKLGHALKIYQEITKLAAAN